MPHSNGLYTLEELHAKPESELVAKIDQLYDGTPTDFRMTFARLLQDEIERRGQDKITVRMLQFTEQVRNMTIAILALTAATVLVAVLAH